MEPKDKKEDDWSFMDTVEAHPEFQDMHEEFVTDFFKKNDPEFYALMKKAGLKEDVDEETTKAD